MNYFIISSKNSKKLEDFLKKENFNFEIFYTDEKYIKYEKSTILDTHIKIPGTKEDDRKFNSQIIKK
jgi:cobalamin biosynthesis protein CbiG